MCLKCLGNLLALTGSWGLVLTAVTVLVVDPLEVVVDSGVDSGVDFVVDSFVIFGVIF